MKRFVELESSAQQDASNVAQLSLYDFLPKSRASDRGSSRAPLSFVSWLPVNVLDQLLAALGESSTQSRAANELAHQLRAAIDDFCEYAKTRAEAVQKLRPADERAMRL